MTNVVDEATTHSAFEPNHPFEGVLKNALPARIVASYSSLYAYGLLQRYVIIHRYRVVRLCFRSIPRRGRSRVSAGFIITAYWFTSTPVSRISISPLCFRHSTRNYGPHSP